MPLIRVTYTDGRRDAYVFSVHYSGAFTLSDRAIARKFSRSQATRFVGTQNFLAKKCRRNEIWQVVDSNVTPPQGTDDVQAN